MTAKKKDTNGGNNPNKGKGKGTSQSIADRNKIEIANRAQARTEESNRRKKAKAALLSGATEERREETNKPRYEIGDLLAGKVGLYALPGGKDPSLHLEATHTYNADGKKILRITVEGVQSGHPLSKGNIISNGVFINAAWLANADFTSNSASPRIKGTQDALVKYVQDIAGGAFEIVVPQDEKVQVVKATQHKIIPEGFRDSFELTTQVDNEKGTRGTIEFEYGGKSVVIHLFRSIKYSGPSFGFVPMRVTRNGVALWENNRINGSFWGLYETAEDGYVLCLESKDSLLQVVSVRAECNKVGMHLNGKLEWVGGLSDLDSGFLKQKMALATGRKAVLTPSEHEAVVAVYNHRFAAEKEKDRQERLAREEAKRLAMLALDAEIRERDMLTVYDEQGATFTGYPVTTDEEWQSLISAPRTQVVMVVGGKPVSTFAVFASGGKRTGKSSGVPVSENNPLIEASPEMIGVKSLKMPEYGLYSNYPVVADKAQVELAQKQGLNSGAIMLCPAEDAEDMLLVLRVFADRIETICEVRK